LAQRKQARNGEASVDGRRLAALDGAQVALVLAQIGRTDRNIMRPVFRAIRMTRSACCCGVDFWRILKLSAEWLFSVHLIRTVDNKSMSKLTLSGSVNLAAYPLPTRPTD
jgi:hypothetical protein